MGSRSIAASTSQSQCASKFHLTTKSLQRVMPAWTMCEHGTLKKRKGSAAVLRSVGC